MDDSGDLRRILSQNIRNARTSLHITQAKLAEFAGISVIFMADIEHCKSWASDKTLLNIARALNMEAYELLMPPDSPDNRSNGKNGGNDNRILRQTAEMVKDKKALLRKQVAEIMDALILEIVKIYGK